MTSDDDLELYYALEQTGVAVWIDGSWAVDAVVGHQTRSHTDLDIAVEEQSLTMLRQCLSGRGY